MQQYKPLKGYFCFYLFLTVSSKYVALLCDNNITGLKLKYVCESIKNKQIVLFTSRRDNSDGVCGHAWSHSLE